MPFLYFPIFAMPDYLDYKNVRPDYLKVEYFFINAK
jgi:hypothetical protein